MTNEEHEPVTIEVILSKALQENDERIQKVEPGSTEYERLAKERDMLMQRWNEKDKMLIEMERDNRRDELEKEKLKFEIEKETPSKMNKVLNVVKVVLDVVGTTFKVVAPTIMAFGVIKISNKRDYLTADDTRNITWMERLVTRN